MKKFIGLIAVLLICSTASVSFASNGPETTKECVISIDNTMEVYVEANEFNYSVTSFSTFKERLKYRSLEIRKEFEGTKEYLSFVDGRFTLLFDEADSAFNNIEYHKLYIEQIYKKAFIFIDPGVKISIFLNTNKTKTVKGATGFNYVNKGNRCRMLLDS